MLVGEYEKAREILKKYSQEHLLSHYERIEEEKKEVLIEQILRIDFEQINNLYQLAKDSETKSEDIIEPTPYIDKEMLTQEELDLYEKTGIKEFEKGNYAVLTMAGGQRDEASDMGGLKVHLCWE